MERVHLWVQFWTIDHILVQLVPEITLFLHKSAAVGYFRMLQSTRQLRGLLWLFQTIIFILLAIRIKNGCLVILPEGWGFGAALLLLHSAGDYFTFVFGWSARIFPFLRPGKWFFAVLLFDHSWRLLGKHRPLLTELLLLWSPVDCQVSPSFNPTSRLFIVGLYHWG